MTWQRVADHLQQAEHLLGNANRAELTPLERGLRLGQAAVHALIAVGTGLHELRPRTNPVVWLTGDPSDRS
jgi:hypothetical protein